METTTKGTGIEELMGRRAAMRLAALFVCGGLLSATALAQKNLAGAAAVKQSLDRLRVVGSVLMIAAHPDDENTAFLAYCSKGRKLRTAYLSLTRGEGGQNLIGSEQGPLLGVIRTQELLAARRIDGAEQFFSRAIDFGFSKTPKETLAKWGREKVLADTVWVIRKFRPDVIVLRFSGTPRDGHGQHQASALLGKEAFRAAADPTRFPEQLQYVKPWQAHRILWNGFAFNRQQEQELDGMKNRLTADTGEYDPVLGYSYGEIAGMSRSQHRSQSMGAAERKGSAMNYFVLVDGQPAGRDFMEEVDTTWRRIPGGAAVDTALAEAQRTFAIDSPESTLPALLKARALAAAIQHPDAQRKLQEIDDTIAMASGVWAEVSAEKESASPGSVATLKLTAIARTKVPVTLKEAWLDNGVHFQTSPVALKFNEAYTRQEKWTVPATLPYTQPLWLQKPSNGTLYTIDRQQDIGPPEGPPVLTASFRFEIGGAEILLSHPVENRYVDRLRGELTRPFVILPPVTAKVSETALLFPSAKPQSVMVDVQSHTEQATGTLRLQAPAGWKVTPASQPFQLAEAGQQITLTFEVTPPAKAASGPLRAIAQVASRDIDSGWTYITYEHIPPQTILPPAETRVVREDVKLAARRIGYIMGAGDAVAGALKSMGAEVTMLDDAELTRGDLSRFDAIVTGVRAWNVREALRANYARVFDYVAAGGTLVTQYNVADGQFFSADTNTLKNVGPYPIKVSRDRVTVEEAPVKFLQPGHALLRFPNTITAADFEGWVQERGLYFASQWDPRYETVLETQDPGEAPLPGGLLYARHGKGAYVFTTYAWFRQLPAGVPGAFKIFANLVSAGKAQ